MATRRSIVHCRAWHFIDQHSFVYSFAKGQFQIMSDRPWIPSRKQQNHFFFRNRASSEYSLLLRDRWQWADWPPARPFFSFTSRQMDRKTERMCRTSFTRWELIGLAKFTNLLFNRLIIWYGRLDGCYFNLQRNRSARFNRTNVCCERV